MPVFVVIIILFFSIFSCKRESKNEIFVGYEKQHINSFYGKLSKKILLNFFKENSIKDFKFVEIKDKKYEKCDFFISIQKIDKVFSFEKKMFKDAVYFLTEDKKLVDFNYPDSIYNLNVGVNKDSLSEEFVRKNFEIKANFYFYDDLNNQIEDFNNNKIQLIILDRIDYYKNLIILPKKYLFFVEFGEEFGYIYFKNIDNKNLFEIFLQSTGVVEKDWLKFVL